VPMPPKERGTLELIARVGIGPMTDLPKAPARLCLRRKEGPKTEILHYKVFC
jgi:hypothetical protein